MKKYLLLLLLLCPALLVQAQDVLYFRDGHTMEVYVKKIDRSLIYYSATPGSPQRYVTKRKVEKIVYARGREQVFREPRVSAARQTPAGYHNVLTLAPVNLLVFGRQSGLGIGLDYERYIGERHLISVRVPVYTGITTSEDIEQSYQPFDEGTYVWTAPGVRVHWLKAAAKADLATGLSVVIGNVNYTYHPNDSYTPNTDRQYLMTAVTLDNDFSVCTRRKVVFGVHTAFGPVFGDFAKDGKWMVQIGMKVGRRF